MFFSLTFNLYIFLFVDKNLKEFKKNTTDDQPIYKMPKIQSQSFCSLFIFLFVFLNNGKRRLAAQLGRKVLDDKVLLAYIFW